MQPVDVLGDDGFQFALPFELGQPQVGRVGLGPLDDELVAIKPIEFLRAALPEGMAEDGFGWVVIFLMIEPVHAPKIRDAALGRNARAAKKDHVLAFGNDFFQCRNHKQKRPFPNEFVLSPV